MDNPAQTNQTNTTVSDEIIVRDADGKFRVLRHGVLEDWTSGVVQHVPQERLPVRVHAEPVVPKAPQPIVATPPPQSSPGRPLDARRSDSFLGGGGKAVVSRFYFDVKDEEEIERFRDKGSVQYRQALNDLAARKAGDIIAKAGLGSPPDEEVRPRLIRAIVSRLKGVRDLIETKEVLLRARELGGVNLNNADANKILRLTEEYRAQFEAFIRDVIVERGEVSKGDTAEQTTGMKQAPHAPSPGLASSAAPSVLSIELPEPPSQQARPFVHPSYRSEESGVQKLESREETNIAQAKNESQLAVSAPKPASVATPIPNSKFQIPNSGTKPALDDVKPSVRIMGPVDELRYMSLKDYRRLASKPTDAADKIVEKVELLADESLIKRGEGVTAWKSSPLYHMYIKIGKESMDKGTAVSRIIDEWQKKSGDTLTAQEFEAIADLNQKLAY